MNKILAILSNPAVILVCTMVIADLKLRLKWSDKPASVIHSIADLLKGLAVFADQIFGQNVSPPEIPPQPAPPAA